MSIAKQIESELSAFYPQGELKALVRLLLHEVAGWSLTDLLTRDNLALTAEQQTAVRTAIARLKQQEPIQYILGYANFCGMRFEVNKNVLIPRPETAELVQLVSQNTAANARILDIGTGSGCIAIALARLLPEAHIAACDISPEALAVARRNAQRLGAQVDFAHINIVQSHATRATYDAIVSNPPYVMASERATMEPNVLDYEPDLALFVPDENPLLFYAAISDFAQAHLADSGKLFFEINHRLAKETADLVRSKGFAQVDLVEDSFGKQRFVTAEKR